MKSSLDKASTYHMAYIGRDRAISCGAYFVSNLHCQSPNEIKTWEHLDFEQSLCKQLLV